MCSCFMPFYGPQCEYKAPSRDKQLDLEDIRKSVDDDDTSDGVLIKRSVDRAMTLTALIFIAVTFLGMVILAWYLSRRRRKDFARWKRMTELAMKSNCIEKLDKQTQITLEYSEGAKETTSLIQSTHSSLTKSNYPCDGNAQKAEYETNQQIETQFELVKPSAEEFLYQKEENDGSSSDKIYQDMDLVDDGKSPGVIENKNTIEPTTYEREESEPRNNDNSVSATAIAEIKSDLQTKPSEKRRTKSKKKAPLPNSPHFAHNQLPNNPQVIEETEEKFPHGTASISANEEYKGLIDDQEGKGVIISNSPQRIESINKYNKPVQQLLSHNTDHPKKHSPIRSQFNVNQPLDHVTSHTIGRDVVLTNPIHNPTANILSSAILDRPYINADEIHTLFNRNIPNVVTPVGCHQDFGYVNPLHTKISSTLPRDYRSNSNTDSGRSNPRYADQPSNWLNAEYLKDIISDKILRGPHEPFVVASQHDALLSELLNRGKESRVVEPRPKSTF
uniref:EGF-like domain-containing protein n=1 Tax=Trichobilharzia regenti TaxID=157069 RepID=A0AA85IX80_TRIRE|nr:unnamed protein product [Trichobilharzia regenti]